MPHVEVEGYRGFDIPVRTRLVNALETNRVDILHCCGGYARCTTCRVAFLAGKPEQMTQAEYNKLDLEEMLGQARLACQITADRDMSSARS
jgi:ferredoxin